MSKLKVNNIEPLSGSVVTLQGGVNIEGTLTAREVRTELTQSSVLYQSGSTKLGDTADDIHQITGSLFTSGNVNLGAGLIVDGTTTLKQDQSITGSLFTSGTRVEFNVAWPEAENEYHLIKTAPFTFNHGSNVRNYQYAAFNLDHFESGNQDLHHSMRLYMYDSHDTPSFGSELVVSPLDVKMQIIPSSSNGEGRTAKIEIRDEENGRTVAGVNANTIDLGSNWVDTQTVRLGNPSASVEVRGDNYTHFGDIKISGSIDNTYPSNKVRFFYPGEGDLPDPAIYHGMFAHVHATGKAYYSHQGGWVVLAESASVDTRFVALESFSSSLDATYATDAELASVSGALSSTITTVSSDLTSISGALSTGIIANASAIAALDSTYATDVELAAVSGALAADIIVNANAIANLDSTYASDAQLTAVSGALATSITDAVTDLNAATSSYALASEVVANTVTGSFATTGSNLFTGNQVISASAVLTLEPSDPLPTGVLTGSLAVSGSGPNTKLYFYNGNSVSGWNEIAFV